MRQYATAHIDGYGMAARESTPVRRNAEMDAIAYAHFNGWARLVVVRLPRGMASDRRGELRVDWKNPRACRAWFRLENVERIRRENRQRREYDAAMASVIPHDAPFPWQVD